MCIRDRLRDELERYYKDSPREHLPLSQQKEFKAIKNMVIPVSYTHLKRNGKEKRKRTG